MSFAPQQDSLEVAEQLDQEDILRPCRAEFEFPKNKSGKIKLTWPVIRWG